jgi:hypothetical protein
MRQLWKELTAVCNQPIVPRTTISPGVTSDGKNGCPSIDAFRREFSCIILLDRPLPPGHPGVGVREGERPVRYSIWALFLTLLCDALAAGQTLKVRPAGTPQPATISSPAAAPATSISLNIPAGTPLKVALDREVRVREVGQSVHGRIAEPVYAFDRLVVPAGSEVNGKIAQIGAVSKKRRTIAALNADFSPYREVQIDFDELVLADGRHLPLQTTVARGSSGVLQFVPARAEKKDSVKDAGKNLASREITEARQEVKREWDTVKKQLHEPAKMHRLERYGMAQLPYHPQYMDAGMSFNAELRQPLEFGTEAVRPEMLSAIGTQPPTGSLVHALLITPLNSSRTKKGDPVDAVVSQPLVVSSHLFLPEGSHIKGSVLQSRPARRLGRNGQLRIVFHELVPPNGIQQTVEASLESVAVAQGEHLTLDSEGGAQVTTPKTRYLTTAISVVLASSSMADHDRDAGIHGADGGGAGQGAANGASGFRFLGTLVGALAHSRVVSSGFGFYGAAMSVYSHFLARGRDVNYPKDMSMLIGLGTREPTPVRHDPAQKRRISPAKPPL